MRPSPGEKIRISGGGRCNFTNLNASPANLHLAESRLRHLGPAPLHAADFVALVERYGIAYHEKTLGQLFCDGSSRQIVDLLLSEMRQANVELRLATSVTSVEKVSDGFALTLSQGAVRCRSLVVASGGKSIPKMGATGFGYDLAQQFGLRIVETRPALVPLTLEPTMLERLSPLAGVSVDAVASCGKTRFAEAMLFTHRGLSGPSILQISSYWREGDEIVLSLLPGVDLFEGLREARAENGRQALQTALSAFLPKRLAQLIAETEKGPANLADYSDKRLRAVEEAVNRWRFKPAGSEGYRTAEVTLGGVDTQRARFPHHGSESRAGPLLHRRGRGRDRLARRLQFSVGLVVRLVRRTGGVMDVQAVLAVYS